MILSVVIGYNVGFLYGNLGDALVGQPAAGQDDLGTPMFITAIAGCAVLFVGALVAFLRASLHQEAPRNDPQG